jgi:hypothetical protein
MTVRPGRILPINLEAVARPGWTLTIILEAMARRSGLGKGKLTTDQLEALLCYIEW